MLSQAERKLRRLSANHEREDYDAINTGLREAVATHHGRKFLWWLLTEAGTFTNPFNPCAATAAFNAGRQSLGQTIIARLEDTSPEAFIRAMKENQDEHRARTAEYDRADRTGDDGYDRTND